jgi:L,D-peptidoglycan transpeptidase YkuD (ErfK/YbiS/YcfS/YnhG family)
MNDLIVRVYPLQKNKSKGRLFWQGVEYACALGKGGILSQVNKAEGDGATPFGLFPLRDFYYRNDKLRTLKTAFSKNIIKVNDAWCDDPKDKNYNQHITLPSSTSYEKLFRNDGQYNVVIPLGYNDGPIIPHKGSAIFFHIAREGLTPTKGCIAISQESMLAVLKTLGPNCLMRVYSSPCIEI